MPRRAPPVVLTTVAVLITVAAAGGIAASAMAFASRAGAAVRRGQIPDRLPTRRHVVALSFDAGADNAGAPKILAVLARTGVPATFFMTGRWAELYPQWAKRIATRYPIGNHTFDHTDLLRLSLPQVAAELDRKLGL